MTESGSQLLKPKEGNPMLSGFNELSMPADINWWPQTLGWQLLLWALFAYLLYRVYLLVKRYISNAYRRAALIEIDQIDDDKLPQLLRRVALYAYPREQVSPLIGHAWETWLDQQCTGCDFSGQHRGLLSQLAYAPASSNSEQELQAFKLQIILWIEQHRGAHD